MIKYFSGIVLIFLCIAVLCATGCTTRPETQEVTPSTPALPVLTITGTPVPETSVIPRTTPRVVVTKTLRPKADPTDLSKITFVRYSDNDFSVDYPSTWTITPSAYTPYYCKNNLDTDSSTFLVCYKNETQLAGPFNFYDESSLKKQRRIVTFTSPDGSIRFVSYTSDFFDGLNGNVMLNPTIEWSRTDFEKNYPDLTGYAAKYIGNYQFFTSGNSRISSYDVTLSKDLRYYPSAYTKRTVVTTHHLYSFAFVTSVENFSKYQNLKEYLFSSITINDAA